MTKSQRIDVWLYHARFYKTRSLATKMVRGGKVRLNGTVCKKASTIVVLTDVLTFAQSRQIRVARVRALGTRRGPAAEAQALYEDLTPPQETREVKERTGTAVRLPGSGRPTKAERRALDKLRNV